VERIDGVDRVGEEVDGHRVAFPLTCVLNSGFNAAIQFAVAFSSRIAARRHFDSVFGSLGSVHDLIQGTLFAGEAQNMTSCFSVQSGTRHFTRAKVGCVLSINLFQFPFGL